MATHVRLTGEQQLIPAQSAHYVTIAKRRHGPFYDRECAERFAVNLALNVESDRLLYDSVEITTELIEGEL